MRRQRRRRRRRRVENKVDAVDTFTSVSHSCSSQYSHALGCQCTRPTSPPYTLDPKPARQVQLQRPALFTVLILPSKATTRAQKTACSGALLDNGAAMLLPPRAGPKHWHGTWESRSKSRVARQKNPSMGAGPMTHGRGRAMSVQGGMEKKITPESLQHRAALHASSHCQVQLMARSCDAPGLSLCPPACHVSGPTLLPSRRRNTVLRTTHHCFPDAATTVAHHNHRSKCQIKRSQAQSASLPASSRGGHLPAHRRPVSLRRPHTNPSP